MTDQQKFGLGVVAAGDGSEIVVCQDDRARTLAAVVGGDGDLPTTIRGMLGDWDGWIGRIEAGLGAGGDSVAVDDLELLPPGLDASAIYCAGANYKDHIAEMKVELPDKSQETIYHFQVAPSSLTGHRTPVYRPTGVERLDWEVELVAVIGRRAWRVPAADALDYIAGYTVVNDVSVRDFHNILHPIFGVRWVMSKGQSTMNPLGPWVVPSKFIEDPMHLPLSLHVNGVARQQSNTEQMIWSVQEQIETLSHKVELQPGDLVMTGTPAGTAAAHDAYLQDGDVMTASVEGIGTLVNTVAPSR